MALHQAGQRAKHTANELFSPPPPPPPIVDLILVGKSMFLFLSSVVQNVGFTFNDELFILLRIFKMVDIGGKFMFEYQVNRREKLGKKYMFDRV